MTRAHFAVSDFIQTPNCSGVLPFGQALERQKVEIPVFSQLKRRHHAVLRRGIL
jgi:hypothetical protein